MKRRQFAAQAAAVIAATAVAPMALAQQDRTIRILVGFPPGGSADVVARVLADKMRVSLAQNVISTFKIRYTYQGDEEMTLAGKKVTVHRVREDPLSAPGVYTLWWYDDQGMGVKRYHVVGGKEIVDELLNWY